MSFKKAVSTCGLHVLAWAALPAAAQVNPLSTTAGLKAACERNPGNVVVVASDLSVNTGSTADAPTRVNTGCRIELAGGADLQFDKVGLSFAGPLTVIGSAQAGLQMQEARLSAPRVQVLLTEVEGSVKMENSRIDASAGSLDLRLGQKGKLEISGARAGGSPPSQAALAATGDLRVESSRYHSGVYKDTGLVAGGSVDLTAPSPDTSIVFENSGAYAYRGQVRFDLALSWCKLEISNASLTALAGDVALAVRGADCVLTASNTAVQAGGGVRVLGTGPKAEVLYGGGSITAGGGGILMEANVLGFDGNLLLANNQLRSGGDVFLRSGNRGKTSVFDNRITAARGVEASTRFLGVCEAGNNQVTAPQLRICP